MAIDATGPPTALGIPKYNPNVDAPSGLGFNAAMDSIDALIAARVPSPTGVASGEVPVWDGAAWVRSSVTRVGSTSLVPAGYGTSLPASPYDGQEFVLVDSTAAPTYQWRFRYNSGSASYKWEFVGAPAMMMLPDPNAALNTQSQVGVTNYWYATAGGSFIIPRTGEYHISGALIVETNTATAQALVGGAFAGSGVIGIQNFSYQAANIGLWSLPIPGSVASGIAAATGVGVAINATTPGTVKLRNGLLSITPVRVS